MFEIYEKYRGLILTTIFVAGMVCLGYKYQDKNKGIQEIEKAESKLEADTKTYDSEVMTVARVEDIVKDYLIKNPQVIIDSLDGMQAKKMEQMKIQVQEQISSHKASLESPSSPFIGNPSGKSIIVMFFDYNCGYCKQSSEAVESVIASNSDVKVILKVYPILGSESEYLARLAIALNVKAPGKFKEIHNEFLTGKIQNKEEIMVIFKEHNINFKSIEDFSNSDTVTNLIKENLQLAKDLKITGVPAFIINGQYFPGFLSAELLAEKAVDTLLPAKNDGSSVEGLDSSTIENRDQPIDTESTKKK